MIEQKGTRQDYLDCVHGLMILQMMFLHLCDFTIFGTTFYDIMLRPLSFFVAWFFFKSGILFKDKNISVVIISGIKKLFIPALIFSFIGSIIYYIINKPNVNVTDELGFLYVFGSFRGNTPLWFLFSLFAVQLIFSFLRKMNFNDLLIIIISIGLFFINKYIGFRPFWTLNIPIGLLFYSFGHMIKNKQFNTITIIFLLIIYLGSFLFDVNYIFVLGRFTPFLIVIPFSMTGCILINTLFKSVPKLCISPLRFFGYNAMQFFCTHLIVITVLCHFTTLLSNIIRILFVFTGFALYIILFSIILHFCKFKKISFIFGR